MPTANVVDLSHYNVIPESLLPAAGSGIAGIVHKATEGFGELDSKCKSRFYLAKEAHLYWALYHFLRPGDMKTQAEHFWEKSQEVITDSTMLACDLEVANISLDDVILFMHTLKILAKRQPVLYSGNILKTLLGTNPAPSSLASYKLWLADYTLPADLPPGYADYWMWQFSDVGEPPGIHSPVDLNYCKDFSTWSGSNIVPAPVIDPVIINLTVPSHVPVRVVINNQPIWPEG